MLAFIKLEVTDKGAHKSDPRTPYMHVSLRVKRKDFLTQVIIHWWSSTPQDVVMVALLT